MSYIRHNNPEHELEPFEKPVSAGTTRCGMHGKICYESEREATRTALTLGTAKALRTFRCHYCGDIHITSS